MTTAHQTARLEALSDGVFAIAITLLALELRVPEISAGGTADVWQAIGQLGPTLFAFLLSFGIIFITWVSHSALLRQVRGTTGPFLYANGAMLLTVVLMPFATALLGRFLSTDTAVPAVVLYNVVLALQGLAWILVTSSALTGQLATGEAAAASLRRNHRHAYAAVTLYSALAVAAFWAPVSVAVATTASWLIWLVRSLEGAKDQP